ncbi:MAG: MFS transporter [Candidatus Shapirobacteria bacterium]|jgi:MFS family permease
MEFHRNIKLLTWFNFFTDFRPYAPVAIIYFAKVSGSYTLGLAVLSIEMLSASIFELPTGIFSDFIGRRKTIILGALMAVLTLICYAIGTNFLILAMGSIFAGLARSFYSGNNQALLHDSLKEYGQEENYAEHSGKVSSMFQWALAGSALFGGVIAYFSFAFVMWLSLIPQLICLYIGFLMVEPKIQNKSDRTNIYSHLKEAILKFKDNSKLRLLSIASVLEYGVGETMYQFSSAFIALLWPVWAIGIYRMLSNILAAIGMNISGKIIKKFGYFKSFMPGKIYSHIVSLIAVIYPSVFSPVLMASSSFSYGVGSVAKDTMFQREFTDKQRATMVSLNSLAGNLFFALFAFLLGFIADKLSPGQALIIGEIIVLPVVFIYWKLFKKDVSVSVAKL